MIFITLGSQKFQFNRLLKEVDNLIEEGIITEEVFAQIGYSDYKPKNYKYKYFLGRDEFKKIMSESKNVITHGGTGAIIGAVKNRKKVIAIPRLKEFGEHVDNHQIQIIDEFSKMNLILAVYSIEELGVAIEKIKNINMNEYRSNTNNIISEINNFIKKI